MKKFKVGDKVKVRSGKDKGREGVIESIKGNKALVSGINIYKKHVKKALTKDNKGGIFDIPRPIDLSKLSVLDPKTGKPTRVGFRIEGAKKGGKVKKVRISKTSDTILDKIK